MRTSRSLHHPLLVFRIASGPGERTLALPTRTVDAR